MRHKILLTILFRSFFISLCFFSLSAFSFGNFCLSQTDLLLLSGGGKSSSSSRKKEIKRLQKRLRAMEGSGGALERAKNKVKNITDELANTLSDEKVRMDGDEAAEKIVLYMEGKERNWEFDNCPSPSQMTRPSTAPSPANRPAPPVQTSPAPSSPVPATSSHPRRYRDDGDGVNRSTGPSRGDRRGNPATAASPPEKRETPINDEDAIITIIEDVPVTQPLRTDPKPVRPIEKSRPAASKDQEQAEEARRQQTEEARRKRAEEARRKQAEEARRKQEQEAKKNDKPPEPPQEETFDPREWFFVPDSSYNNQTNPFLHSPKKILSFLMEQTYQFKPIPSDSRLSEDRSLWFIWIPAFAGMTSFHFLFPVAHGEEICAPWQNPPLSRRFFRSNGRVRAKAFCKAYAHKPRECRDQLEALEKALDRIQKVDNQIQRLENQLSALEQEQEDEEFEKTISDEEETEARGFCVECLSDLRGALAPSGWQRFGSGLTTALGLGLSVAGVREARQNDGANSLLAAWMGVPWITQGLHGLSRDIAPEYVCSPHFYNNPYVYNPYIY